MIIGRTLDEYTELLSTDSKLPIHFGAAESKLQASVTFWGVSAQHDAKGASSYVLAIEMHLVTLSYSFQILSSNLRRMITMSLPTPPLPSRDFVTAAPRCGVPEFPSLLLVSAPPAMKAVLAVCTIYKHLLHIN